MKAREFLQKLRHDDIVAAIRQAELMASGEIRVLVSHKKSADTLTAAKRAFTRLGMTKTRERNGVLIFVIPRTRQFAVIGDEGVHKRCGDDFWQQLAGEMSSHFQKSEFNQGILHAIRRAGELLAEHFPRRPDDRNELPDQVVQD